MRSTGLRDTGGDVRGARFAKRRNVSIGVVMGGFLAVSVWTFGFAALSPATAAECNEDIGALTQKRQAIIDQLNKVAKASPKGQLDPTAACPKLRNLAVIEHQLSDYLTKNKEWCMVPDAAITNIETSAKHTLTIAGQACKVAEQIKKGQQAGAAAAPKLPTGPL